MVLSGALKPKLFVSSRAPGVLSKSYTLYRRSYVYIYIYVCVYIYIYIL